MTTTVMLVRHAQTNSNVTGYYMGWSDEDLDEVGYAQANRLSSRLGAALLKRNDCVIRCFTARGGARVAIRAHNPKGRWFESNPRH